MRRIARRDAGEPCAEAPGDDQQQLDHAGPLCAAQLGLPDLLASGPQTSEHLARVAGVHAPALHRLLRALVTLEIVREREDGDFALLPMGELLRSDAATSLRAWAIFAGKYKWQTWGYLLDSVKTGQSANELLTGTETYEHLAQCPEQATLFNQAMGERTRLIVPAVVQAYDFTGLKRIIDVGGGHGELLVAILKAYPEACVSVGGEYSIMEATTT